MNRKENGASRFSIWRMTSGRRAVIPGERVAAFRADSKEESSDKMFAGK